MCVHARELCASRVCVSRVCVCVCVDLNLGLLRPSSLVILTFLKPMWGIINFLDRINIIRINEEDLESKLNSSNVSLTKVLVA